MRGLVGGTTALTRIEPLGRGIGRRFFFWSVAPHGISWQRGRHSGGLFGGDWRADYGVI
jgi:hypothetical protein